MVYSIQNQNGPTGKTVSLKHAYCYSTDIARSVAWPLSWRTTVTKYYCKL